MGISQPKVSALLRGDLAALSDGKLMGCPSRLGYDIEIKAKPAGRAAGHLRLSVR